MKKTIRIETREHLLATLAEAAELEHNLMCMYLYAAFSLKNSESEGLAPTELQAVQRWRKAIVDIAVQEMGHLALVSNITSAIGGAAHFYRTNFPVQPGYFPEAFVLELRPFDESTLAHFVYLERPELEPVADDPASDAKPGYARGSPRDRLMAHVGDYKTVGELYEVIAHGIQSLVKEIGEKALFCGSPQIQIGPDDVELAGLMIVKGMETALAAIAAIVEQGEGGRARQGSHFEIFCGIQAEYTQLLGANPGFLPSRPAARNPVMQKPIATTTDVVWVSDEVAALHLDLANALYGLMLRLLAQIYSQEGRDTKSKKALLASAFTVMHSLGETATTLTTMAANSTEPGTNAGISFTLGRHFASLEVSIERRLLGERVDEILDFASELPRMAGVVRGLTQLKVLLAGEMA